MMRQPTDNNPGGSTS